MRRDTETGGMAAAERWIGSALPPIEAGAIHAYFVYDVADMIDLDRLGRLGLAEAGGVARAPIQLRPEVAPGTVEFPVPPVVATLTPAPVGARSATVRAKFFDYGVVSLRLTFPFAGTWDAYADEARGLRSDGALAAAGQAAFDRLSAEIAPALRRPHEPLVEDYLVFEVRRFAQPTFERRPARPRCRRAGAAHRGRRPAARRRGTRRSPALPRVVLRRRSGDRPLGRGVRL